MNLSFFANPSKKIKGLLVLGLFTFVLSTSSCGPNEIPLADLPDPVEQTIVINPLDLANHYYSLTTKKIVSSSAIPDWDLSFCAQTDKYYLYLNCSKNMKLSVYDGNFSDKISLDLIQSWKSDLIRNGKATTAMGNWGDFSFANPKSYGKTYIIDLGYVNYFGEFGYRKLQILGCSQNVYTICFARLDDPFGDTLNIEKDGLYNHQFFTFRDGGRVVKIEPPSSDWDLNFTQYGLSQLVLKDSVVVDTSYQWTDYVLLNNNGRQIACDSLIPFDQITFWDAEDYTYSPDVDFIGNKWRRKVPQEYRYELTRRNVYVVKTRYNQLYKIEFLSLDKNSSGISKITFRVKNL